MHHKIKCDIQHIPYAGDKQTGYELYVLRHIKKRLLYRITRRSCLKLT